MRFNKKKAFIDSFPAYMISLAFFILGNKIEDIVPTSSDVGGKVFTLFALVFLIPATAYLITGGMKDA